MDEKEKEIVNGAEIENQEIPAVSTAAEVPAKHGRSSKIGLILIAVGMLAFISAAGLFIFNYMQDMRAGRDAAVTYTKIQEKIPENEDPMSQIDPKYLGTGEMPYVTIDGLNYIGTVEIPSLDLKLPVQSEWSDELSKISPCRYKGSVYDGNLIIAGHNYKTHFRGIKLLGEGAEVKFTDVDGHTFSYVVKNIETMEMHEVQRMEEGEWDLTLFTCTFGGKYRIALRCDFK